MKKKDIALKVFVICMLVGSYFFLPKYGFTSFPAGEAAGTVAEHFLWPFSHANIWHLLANMVFLWMMPCRLHIVETYLIAVVCSFLPGVQLYSLITGGDTEATMGYSGALFAMVGISWGRVGRFKDMITKNKWYLIVPMFIPHVNAMIHIYCLVGGYLWGRFLPVGKATGTGAEPSGNALGTMANKGAI